MTTGPPPDGESQNSPLGTAQCYAHTLPGQPPETWQPLEEHLGNVAHLARRFADPFGAGDWAHLAGLWHDLGKYSMAFQRYLKAAGQGDDYHSAEIRGKVDHTTAGAQHATATIEILGHLLAYPIAGHHAGLLDATSDRACLEARLKKTVEPWRQRLREAPAVTPPKLPGFLTRALGRRAHDPQRAAFTFAFFVRMLFSSLVDADFLDTEQFVNPEQAGFRPAWPPKVFEEMEQALDDYVNALSVHDTPVDRKRRAVRESCLDTAALEPGFFSLTVPTGGGKTLSSLAFAIRHARRHGLARIIYVVPFTSIIEQNAAVFRRVFRPLAAPGLPDPVLEHHSALDVGKETVVSRLAAENWDAPLVVTTSVQFYESLFSRRPSRCRKLHNIARSVVILDEVQKIPVDFLAPCLFALRELAENYGASVVLCTATQPAVHRRKNFSIGLEDVREIIPDPPALYRTLKRVDVVAIGRTSDQELVARLQQHEQVLCIVNTRRHARELYARMSDGATASDSVFHLSAAMCPEHRSAVLSAVAEQLKQGSPCRVVSTQIVEAGVDVDFPVVYRSLAGLDSIAQAAGRCNRNGRLHRGTTFVFESEHREYEQFLNDTVAAAVQILGAGDSEPLYSDLLSLEAVEHFFRLYYWAQQERWDSKRILHEFNLVNNKDLPFLFGFETVGKRFRLIEDTGEPVIVPWDRTARKLCDRLRNTPLPPPRNLLRKLQRYTVQVPKRAWRQAQGRTVEMIHDRYPVLISPEIHYDERLGLVLEREELDSDTFIT